jgi:hypothetical protein
VNLESLLHPATILFIIGFVFGSISPQLRHRQKMMFCKFMGDGFIALYLFTLGGLSGGCGAAIAATGALIQALTPHKYLKQTIWLRMGIALILSVTSIYLVYKTPIDLLPITMVILCRFAELQNQAQRIRIVYFATCFPWMTYHYLNDFYLPLIACIIGTVSLLVAIIRHHHPHKEEKIV